MSDTLNNPKKVIQSIKYLVDKSSQQFELVACKLPNAQAARIKTLLWISSVLILAKFQILNTLFKFRLEDGVNSENGIFALTFLLSLYTFTYTAFAFRTNEWTSVPFGNPYNILLDLIENDENNDYTSFYYTMVSHIHNGLQSCYDHITKTGKKIRIITILIVSDIILSTVLCFTVIYQDTAKILFYVYASMALFVCYVSTEDSKERKTP